MPLAAPLGGLLFLAVLGLGIAVVPLLPPGVFRQPKRWFGLVQAPARGQLLLWGGWLVIGTLAFGLAASTRTHPYYLSQLAAPCAAVLAIGLTSGWHHFRHRARLAWAFPTGIALGGAYQLYLLREAASAWAQAASMLVLAATAGVLTLALWQRVTDTPLAKAAAVAGCLALLAVPLSMSSGQTGMVVGVRPPAPAGSATLPGPPPGGQDMPRVLEAVSKFISARGDAGSVFAAGVVRASEAAPFIIRGIPAVAIGGFSGRDPIFTPETLEAMARQGKLRYFLAGGREAAAGPDPQGAILNYIRRTWQDVSSAAGLPPGTLYRYPGP